MNTRPTFLPDHEIAQRAIVLGDDTGMVVAGPIEVILAGMFGPYQHDQHVQCWRGEKWLTDRREGNERGFAACMEFVGALKARRRAREG